MRRFCLALLIAADLSILASTMMPAFKLDQPIAGAAHFMVALVNVVAIAWHWPRWRYHAAFVVIAVAGAVEWVQLYVPGRTGSVTDASLDVAGAAAGWAIAIAAQHRTAR